MGLRTRRGLALAASLAFVISACTPGASSTPAASSGGTESTAPSASTGVTSDNFKFAVDGEPTYFSLAYTDLPTSWIVGMLYNGMYRIDDKLAVVPDIAAALPEQSADGLTWTIKLRDDVKWHDGTPVTADDVKFTYDLALSPNCTYIPDTCSAIGDNVESVTVVDPTTVEFKLKQKFAPFLIQLAGILMPKAAVTASYEKFASTASAVDAAAVATLADKIKTATSADACSGETPPAECLASTYTAEVEPILTQAGITLPDKNAYTVDGTLDPDAYGQALIDQLNDLNSHPQGCRHGQDRGGLPPPRLPAQPDRHRPLQVRQVHRRSERRAGQEPQLPRRRGRAGERLHPDHQGRRHGVGGAPEGRHQLADRGHLGRADHARRGQQPGPLGVPRLRLLLHRLQPA